MSEHDDLNLSPWIIREVRRYSSTDLVQMHNSTLARLQELATAPFLHDARLDLVRLYWREIERRGYAAGVVEHA